MLETLKKNKNSKKIFYGVNSGNYGFLMNKYSPKKFSKNLLNAKKIRIQTDNSMELILEIMDF